MDREVKEGLVNLKVGDYLIECDRKMLAANSPYFHAMFSGNFAEKSQSEIQLNDIDFSCLATILLAIKGEGIDWSVCEDDLISTLATAHMLQFESVEEEIINFIAHNWLSIDNCLKVFMMADKLSLIKLCKKAKLLAVNNVVLTIRSQSFLELSIKEVCEFLSDNNLNINSERVICDAVINWIKYDFKNRADNIKDLLTVIRFSQLSCEVIEEYLSTSLFSKIPFAHSFLQCIACKQSDHWNCYLWMQKFSESMRKMALECLALPKRRGSFVACIVGGILRKPETTERIRCSDEKSNLYDNYLFIWIDNDLKPVIPLCSAMHSNLEGARIVRKDMHLYVVGGERKIGSGIWNNEIKRYDLSTEKWEEITRLPKPRRHQGTCIIGDELFIIGGMSKYRVQVDLVDVFNLETGLWSQCPAMPTNCNSSVPWCVHRKNIFLFCSDGIHFLPPPRSHWHCLKSRSNFVTTAAVSDEKFIYLIGSIPAKEKLNLYRLNPDLPDEEVCCLGQLASRGCTNICIINNVIYCFTKGETTSDQGAISSESGDNLYLETYDIDSGQFICSWMKKTANITFFPSVGCFSMPHLS